MALNRAVKEIVSKDRVKPLMVSHPVYDYFARRYGLMIKSVHWEPDEILTNENMMELNHILKEHPAKWMIWEGEPSPEITAKLAETGIKSVVFDPCGGVPDAGDFASVMQRNIAALKLVGSN